jgi:hypothetical protein
MNPHKINVAQIVTIEIFLKREYRFDYEYRRELRLFGYIVRKPYFAHKSSLMGDIPLLKLIIDGEKLYYKPYIEIRMANGDSIIQPFSSKDALDKFLDLKEFKEINFLTL